MVAVYGAREGPQRDSEGTGLHAPSPTHEYQDLLVSALDLPFVSVIVLLDAGSGRPTQRHILITVDFL